jgi:hypothetical protein
VSGVDAQLEFYRVGAPLKFACEMAAAGPALRLCWYIELKLSLDCLFWFGHGKNKPHPRYAVVPPLASEAQMRPPEI